MFICTVILVVTVISRHMSYMYIYRERVIHIYGPPQPLSSQVLCKMALVLSKLVSRWLASVSRWPQDLPDGFKSAQNTPR